MLLKESVDTEINTSIWFRCMKKKVISLTEDKRKDKAQRAHTCQNPKMHMPLVRALWPCAGLFGLQPCECDRAGRQSKIQVYIQPPLSVFFV